MSTKSENTENKNYFILVVASAPSVLKELNFKEESVKNHLKINNFIGDRKRC